MNILITGASSGIGRATARRLAARGHRLVLVARRKERLEALCAEFGARAVAFALDVSNPADIHAFAQAHAATLTDVDVLINNAGLALSTDPLQAQGEEDIAQMIQTNVLGLLLMTRKILPAMIARKSGHILNLGSVAAHTAYRGGSVYCASKAAVHMLTDALRLDVGGTGVRVSTIAPGRVAETEFSEVRFKGDVTKAQKVYEGYRTMSADDVAEAIVWMLERPAHINVQELVILPTDQPSATTLEPLRPFSP